MTHRPQHPQPSLFRPVPTVVHLIRCDCPTCPPPSLSATQIAAWALAGSATGSAIAFAIDPHGAWYALASAVAQLLGAR